MKKVPLQSLLIGLLLVFPPHTTGMFCKTKPLKNTLLSLNTRDSFGKTHFIAGYDHTSHKHDHKKTVKIAPQEKTNNNSAKKLLNKNEIVQEFFTTDDELRDVITEAIDQAKYCIRIAAFAFTDKIITDHIKKAYDAGIIIEVITDFENMNKRYSRIKDLVAHNIPVCHYSSALNTNPKQKNSRYACMHHKFMIFDDTCLITGSANYTVSGQKDNIENIVVIWVKKTIDRFIKQFDRLKTHCVECRKE